MLRFLTQFKVLHLLIGHFSPFLLSVTADVFRFKSTVSFCPICPSSPMLPSLLYMKRFIFSFSFPPIWYKVIFLQIKKVI